MVKELRYFLLLWSSITLVANLQGSTINILPEHPRVFLTSYDLPIIREKIKTELFKETWKTIVGNNHPLCKAFQGILLGNTEMLTKAAIDFFPVLQKEDDGRTVNHGFLYGACIYDWCYYQMDKQLKEAYIAEFKRIANLHPPYFPAKNKYGVLVGHDCEGWLLTHQLSGGLAIYDEDPVMLDSAAAVFFDRYVPARNFFYQAHMHHQGDSYMATRFEHDMYASWLFDKMGTRVFCAEQQFVPYQLLYNMRPDGQQMRSGDTYDDSGRNGGGQAGKLGSKSTVFAMCGALYNDPILMGMSDAFPTEGLFKVFELIMLPKEVKTAPMSDLPTTKYFPYPMGEMVARTGWDMGLESNDAVIQMRIGNYFFGNHQMPDFGTFQIYFHGPLAISSGVYEGTNAQYFEPHWRQYYHQTISKNGLLIYDPREAMDDGFVNSGGQRRPLNHDDHPKDLKQLLNVGNGYKMGEVTAWGFGPDPKKPKYSYIAGDISDAYSKAKTEKVTRSMLMINTGNEKIPALFYVFDEVSSTNKDFKKTWLLHTIQEPEVKNNTFSVIRDENEFSGKGKYSGKLVGQTLLPENAVINIVGGSGKEFWIESNKTNYYTVKDNPATEPGVWRVEVSPKVASQYDAFLHAMAVTQSNNSEKINFDYKELSCGKQVSGMGYVVIFGNLMQAISNYTVNVEPKTKGLFISDVKPGIWIYRENEIVVPEASSCLYIQNPKHGCVRIHKKR